MTGDWGSCRQRFPVCVHMFEGQSWLDAHTNPALLPSDVKDHLSARACHGGGGEWFMPRSSGLSWSQYKQLQLSWVELMYSECVCMWVGEGWRERNTAVWLSWDLSLVCMCAGFMISLRGQQWWFSVGRTQVALGLVCHGTYSDNGALRGFDWG